MLCFLNDISQALLTQLGAAEVVVLYFDQVAFFEPFFTRIISGRLRSVIRLLSCVDSILSASAEINIVVCEEVFALVLRRLYEVAQVMTLRPIAFTNLCRWPHLHLICCAQWYVIPVVDPNTENNVLGAKLGFSWLWMGREGILGRGGGGHSLSLHQLYLCMTYFQHCTYPMFSLQVSTSLMSTVGWPL